MEMQLKKATRKQVKLRMGLSGVAGSGKTASALLLAYGMTNDWDKIAVIDTENSSSELYSDFRLPNDQYIGQFNTISLKAPFTPESYVAAIKTCERAGMEVIIIDSITHEWEGKGGCLEIADQITQASSSKNSYTAWGKVTPRHNAFIESILQSTCHIITTVRRKQDYEMSKNANGKTVVEKAGLKEITREGYEYELTVNFNIEINHLAKASKDRTGLFMDYPEFTITPETGKKILDWCNKGEVTEPLYKSYLKLIEDANDVLTTAEQDLMTKDCEKWDDNKVKLAIEKATNKINELKKKGVAV